MFHIGIPIICHQILESVLRHQFEHSHSLEAEDLQCELTRVIRRCPQNQSREQNINTKITLLDKKLKYQDLEDFGLSSFTKKRAKKGWLARGRLYRQPVYCTKLGVHCGFLPCCGR